MMPLVRCRANAASGVFLTVPCFVAKNTNLSSSNAFTGSTVLMRSPSSSGNRFTIGRPRAPGAACGTWYTLSQYALPRLEKQRTVSCEFATNS